MKTIHELEQGSESWHAFRADHFGASEAAAMLGISKYQTRAELLRRKATGIEPEVSPQLQAVFDRGHATEIGGRVMAQAIIGQELYPVTVSEGKLSASCDGLTMIEDIAFEHKQYNAALADSVRAGVLPAEHQPQCQQVMMLTGADKLLFMVSDGTSDNCAWMWVEPEPAIRKTLLQGWAQFAIDLEAYEHVEQTVAPSGRAPDSLPALLIEVTGMVTASNLAEFKSHAMTVFGSIKTALATDADFADAEKTVKWCKEVEDRLDAAKSHALAQTASIDELFRVIDQIKEESRSKRLALDKLVKAEKENRRAEIVSDAQNAYIAHFDRLNERVGGFMPRTLPPFGEVIKGLKSLDSMRDKVSAALANAKIEANEIADRIEINKRTLDGQDDIYMALFPDLGAIIAKPNGDFMDTVNARIAAYKTAETKKAEDAKKAAEAARMSNDQRGKADAGVGVVDTARAQPEAAITPPTPEEKRAIAVESGDMVRAYLNSLNITETERARLRPYIMGFVLFTAGQSLAVAA